MLVSVIIPTYNRFTFVQRAINSVLAQTHSDVEIIVIDDCSTDTDYLTLPSLYKDYSNVSIIRNDVNFRTKFNSTHAQGETRNVGLRAVNPNAEWIAFLDDDDFWFPTKLSRQLQAMSQLHTLMSCTNAYKGHGIDIQSYSKELLLTEPVGYVTEWPTVYRITLPHNDTNNWIINSSVLIHKTLFERVGFLKAEKYEDFMYWKRCLQFTHCANVFEPLVGYDASHGFGQHYRY